MAGAGGELRAHHDDLGPLASPGEVEVRLVEIGLGLGADLVVLGDEHRLADGELTPAFGDVGPHRRLRHGDAQLVSDPLPDPVGGVALLAGCRLVGHEDRLHEVPVVSDRAVGGDAAIRGGISGRAIGKASDDTIPGGRSGTTDGKASGCCKKAGIPD